MAMTDEEAQSLRETLAITQAELAKAYEALATPPPVIPEHYGHSEDWELGFRQGRRINEESMAHTWSDRQWIYKECMRLSDLYWRDVEIFRDLKQRLFRIEPETWPRDAALAVKLLEIERAERVRRNGQASDDAPKTV